MTTPEYWTHDETDEYDFDVEGEAQAERNFPTVPVKVVFDENEQLTPTFCSCMTWPVPAVNTTGALLVLPRQEKRFKSQLVALFPGAGTLYFNTKVDPLNNPTPQGFAITVAAAGLQLLPPYECMQPMYAIASIPGVTLSIWDEVYGKVAAS